MGGGGTEGRAKVPKRRGGGEGLKLVKFFFKKKRSFVFWGSLHRLNQHEYLVFNISRNRIQLRDGGRRGVVERKMLNKESNFSIQNIPAENGFISNYS